MKFGARLWAGLEDGDYFAVLGVRPGALGDGEVLVVVVNG